ncbi:uncharacterized protein si:dkey-33c12.4 [Clupea harengus]|uniref:Uncharacterized protein si:dkey-33c12.4 n=1 Tax=Clupea harengus TaxID=7950 RepID=A0A6P3VVU1_CLUHA|nr:uncharacterized protein si:dkey-33c12.4 [Clupea harengus]
MSSTTAWATGYLRNPRILQAHETIVDMLHGRTPFNLLDALSVNFGADDEDPDSSGSSDNERSSGPYCGLNRNFLQRSGPRVTVVTTRQITREAIKAAEKSAEELIEEEERLKKKAENKRLKKLRQKEKKRLQKQEKENANKTHDKQNNGEGIKKNQNKKSAESADVGPQCHSDLSSEEEDEDKDSISSEQECRKTKKQLQKREKKNYNETDDEKTIDSKEDVCIKGKNQNKKSAELHPDKGPECSSDGSSDEEEDEEKESVRSDTEDLDMSSCFVSNAAAAISKRKLKTKEKKDKKDKRTGESGKDFQKPNTEQQNSKAHQKEVTPLSTQNPVKEDPERNITDLISRSMELACIGNQYAANGNLEMAVKYFTDAIMYNTREYKLFGNRSFCFERMQQYEKSLMDANVALSMNPQWIKGLYRKGRALTGLKRYMEAVLVYKEVLTQDSSCADAAQELIKVQIMQLMEMGFTKEQSANAMIIHGSVEKALDALSGLHGTIPVHSPPVQEDWVRVEKRSQSPKADFQVASQPVQQPVPQTQPQPQASPQSKYVKPELFPVWFGGPMPVLTEAYIYDLFNQVGPVHSVKVLRSKGCAFVNYYRKQDSEEAVKKLHGIIVAGGIPLTVRFPDRIHPHLGVSQAAATECTDKLPDECYFWRSSGCIKSQNCQYRHIPQNKGIDRNKFK